ncbi:uncharacterized protein LOC129303722 [Prosopis cineraria]|uniref:uncharacterized protein LOC129303722 n=1 Tax=Prosopis cineraria TaxID=364024 RepID=UPI002410489F|nr:uncharacterized protein LOC129303722 [Prosopis cineraria]
MDFPFFRSSPMCVRWVICCCSRLPNSSPFFPVLAHLILLLHLCLALFCVGVYKRDSVLVPSRCHLLTIVDSRSSRDFSSPLFLLVLFERVKGALISFLRSPQACLRSIVG